MKLNDEMKETYREALTSAMQTWKTEDIVIDGEIVQKGGKEILSLPFPYFIKNMAAILALFVYINSKYSLFDFASMMSGNSNDYAFELNVTLDLEGFMKWLLSQEIEEDETMGKMWYGFTSLSEKWNEYFRTKVETENETE